MRISCVTDCHETGEVLKVTEFFYVITNVGWLVGWSSSAVKGFWTLRVHIYGVGVVITVVMVWR
jgi:hypothetical protein